MSAWGFGAWNFLIGLLCSAWLRVSIQRCVQSELWILICRNINSALHLEFALDPALLLLNPFWTRSNLHHALCTAQLACRSPMTPGQGAAGQCDAARGSCAGQTTKVPGTVPPSRLRLLSWHGYFAKLGIFQHCLRVFQSVFCVARLCFKLQATVTDSVASCLASKKLPHFVYHLHCPCSGVSK